MPFHAKSLQQVHYVTIDRRMPSVSVDDLAVMLEIDLTLMGDKKGFRNRLQRALNDALRQGVRLR